MKAEENLMTVDQFNREIHYETIRMATTLEGHLEAKAVDENDHPLPDYDIVWHDYPDKQLAQTIVRQLQVSPQLVTRALPENTVMMPRNLFERIAHAAGLDDDQIKQWIDTGKNFTTAAMKHEETYRSILGRETPRSTPND